MLNFGASKPRVKGGARAPGPPPDPHLVTGTIPIGGKHFGLIYFTLHYKVKQKCQICQLCIITENTIILVNGEVERQTRNQILLNDCC